MYFNVNFNVLFNLIKVHLLVSELYIWHSGVHWNDKMRMSGNADFCILCFLSDTWGSDTGKTTSFPLWVRVSYLVFLCHRVFWLCLSLNWLRFSLLSFACHVTCCIATLHQWHCYCCCCHWRTDYRKSELWQPKKRGRRTSQWMSSKGRSIQTTVWLTAASTQVTVGLATGV